MQRPATAPAPMPARGASADRRPAGRAAGRPGGRAAEAGGGHGGRVGGSVRRRVVPPTVRLEERAARQVPRLAGTPLTRTRRPAMTRRPSQNQRTAAGSSRCSCASTLAREAGFVVVVVHGDRRLGDDRAHVDFRSHEVDRASVDARTFVQRAPVRVQSGVQRQQRRMHVDEAARMTAHERFAEHAHESGQDDEIGSLGVDGIAKRVSRTRPAWRIRDDRRRSWRRRGRGPWRGPAPRAGWR